MSQEDWTAVDSYLTEKLIAPDAALTAAMRANAAANLPSIDVTATQGKFLHLLARICGARRILEVGTLGGYSTIWLARALPAGGRLISLEFEPKHAAVATENVRNAGLSDRVEIRVGAAAESLDQLHAEGAAPFDLIFLDADKPNNAVYLESSLRLSRPGTVILVDNVIREGAILDLDSGDPSIQGTRRLFDALASHPQLDATALQTVGSKGHDGFVLAMVK